MAVCKPSFGIKHFFMLVLPRFLSRTEFYFPLKVLEGFWGSPKTVIIEYRVSPNHKFLLSVTTRGTPRQPATLNDSSERRIFAHSINKNTTLGERNATAGTGLHGPSSESPEEMGYSLPETGLRKEP